MNGNEELTLAEELQLLEKDYTVVAMTTLASLIHSKVPANYIYQHILNLPQQKKEKYKKLVEKRAKGLLSASLEQVFLSFSPYCDFLNPDMLELIVERFGDEINGAIVNMYLQRLSCFYKKTTLLEMVDKWVAITPPGYTQLSLEMDTVWRKKTLKDLEVFRSHMSRMPWFFKCIKEKGEGSTGSVVVVFSVPKGVWLYQEDLCDLRMHRVLQILEGERCVVDLGQYLNIERPITRSRSLESYLSDDRLNLEWQEETTFSLPGHVQFGFHRKAGVNVFVSMSSQKAMIVDSNTGSGIAYSALPLSGHTEFEIRLVDYSGSKHSSLKLGLMKRRVDTHTSLESSPKPSEHRDNSCTWFKSRFKKKSEFQNNFGTIHLLRYYGFVDLLDLRQEDKMGLQLSAEGNLSFFVNGVSQGVAAQGIYQPGFHVYCYVELVDGYRSVEITRAVMQDGLREDINGSQ